ncbi:hypothetical protein [Candidatus Poriferisodalis sp.]|uniref:hypothetical protein n=1 Tax=Candidatus Poriferisodalis sp. TaxID=3101277 RepID=UPI003B0145B1
MFPGSFNPPTTAHVAISNAARAQHRLDVLVWSVSRVALAKEDVQRPLLDDRLTVLREVASSIDWLEVAVTDAQLLADVAAGFDVIVMGADKWHQIHDPVFYDGDTARRDAAISSLPTPAIAPRPPHDVPVSMRLAVPAWVGSVSSTMARSVDPAVMVPEAARFDAQTGAWTDPARYERWRTTRYAT